MKHLLVLAILLAFPANARADDVYQTVAQTLGYNQQISVTLTQFIAAPPIATQSIRILALQEMAAVVSGGGPVELEYGTGLNCGTGTTLFAVLSVSGSSVVTTQNGAALGDGRSAVFIIPAGNAACVAEPGATGLQGFIAGTYIYY